MPTGPWERGAGDQKRRMADEADSDLVRHGLRRNERNRRGRRRRLRDGEAAARPGLTGSGGGKRQPAEQNGENGTASSPPVHPIASQPSRTIVRAAGRAATSAHGETPRALEMVIGARSFRRVVGV
jgi:hypothetical protein